jgi:hypothetical protein
LRAYARDQALGADGGCPALAGRPPQRHIEQDHRPDMESCEGVGTHNRSCPDWKHEPAARMLSPGLSEARVQHPTSVGSVSANPNEVRVRGANVPPTPELFSFFWYSLERKLV